MLIRHLRMYYVLDDTTKIHLKNFIYDFYKRWKTYDQTADTDLLTFSNRRQQGESDLETRDIILRQIFFKYISDNTIDLKEKDTNRAFSELQRILIYRKGKGLCQQCLRDDVPEKEARVSWSKYQADHVLPHSKGGETIIENGELLCSFHNQSKGNRV